MKSVIFILLIVSLFYSCNNNDETDKPNTKVYGTYDEIGDANGILIVNEDYIDYRNNAWYTEQFDLDNDSLKFHVSRAKDDYPDEIVTWWFELKIYESKLEGNNFKTVNFDPDFKEERGIVTFIKR